MFGEVRGNTATEDERPSNVQLAALKAWIEATPQGRKRAPFVDFAVWGPRSHIMLDEMAFAPRMWLPGAGSTGEWAP